MEKFNVKINYDVRKFKNLKQDNAEVGAKDYATILGTDEMVEFYFRSGKSAFLLTSFRVIMICNSNKKSITSLPHTSIKAYETHSRGKNFNKRANLNLYYDMVGKITLIFSKKVDTIALTQTLGDLMSL